MYFWNIEKLKLDISNGRLTEGDRFVYAFIYFTLSTVGYLVNDFFPNENINFWDSFYSIATIIVAAVGTLLAFKVNGGSSGTDFLGKYFSIGFVIGVRFSVLLIPIFFAKFYYYKYLLRELSVIHTTPLEIIPSLILHIMIYWRVCVHIHDCSGKQRRNK